MFYSNHTDVSAACNETKHVKMCIKINCIAFKRCVRARIVGFRLRVRLIETHFGKLR